MEEGDSTLLLYHFKKNKRKKKRVRGFYSRDDFSWDGDGTLPHNTYKPSQEHISNFIVKKNHIGLTVSEICLNT